MKVGYFLIGVGILQLCVGVYLDELIQIYRRWNGVIMRVAGTVVDWPHWVGALVDAFVFALVILLIGGVVCIVSGAIDIYRHKQTRECFK